MNRYIRTALAIATSLSSGCAGGGPSGTHFSTATGNLVSASGQSGVEGVRVSVETTAFGTVTDDGGNFAIRGEFAGPVTLLFERGTDGLVARIGIVVPGGGTVTLRNVSCSGSSGLCQAEDIDVDEPDDDDVSAPSVEDPSDPSTPSPPEDDGEGTAEETLTEEDEDPDEGDSNSDPGAGDEDEPDEPSAD